MGLPGAALLGVVLYRADLAAVRDQVLRLGWGGFGLVLLVYLACLSAQSAAWLCTVPGVPATPRWLYRVSKVSLVGFALQATTPLAGLGGEPIKAILLKRRHGLPYRDVTASLIVARTIDLTGELLFAVIGLGLMLSSPPPALDTPSYRLVAGGGVAAMVVFVAALFLAQQRRALGWLRSWFASSTGGGLVRRERLLAALEEIEDRLAAYYSAEPGRCLIALLFAVADWVIGACAVYLTLTLLGQHVSPTDAVVIEAFLTIVRSALFMVPADLGTQEGALALICGALLGSPETGFALATIRRGRDVVWVVWGLVLAYVYTLRPLATPAGAVVPVAARPLPP
jgi:uncharacterized protein (TIRG00374 family)